MSQRTRFVPSGPAAKKTPTPTEKNNETASNSETQNGQTSQSNAQATTTNASIERSPHIPAPTEAQNPGLTAPPENRPLNLSGLKKRTTQNISKNAPTNASTVTPTRLTGLSLPDMTPSESQGTPTPSRAPPPYSSPDPKTAPTGLKSLSNAFNSKPKNRLVNPSRSQRSVAQSPPADTNENVTFVENINAVKITSYMQPQSEQQERHANPDTQPLLPSLLNLHRRTSRDPDLQLSNSHRSNESTHTHIQHHEKRHHSNIEQYSEDRSRDYKRPRLYTLDEEMSAGSRGATPDHSYRLESEGPQHQQMPHISQVVDLTDEKPVINDFNLFSGHDLQQYVARNAEKLEASRIRWENCTMKEWEDGAKELADQFGEVLDSVKENMSKKLKLWASLHSSLDDHQKVLEERKAKLTQVQDELVKNAGGVMRGGAL
ncbi:hypothetical protein SISNIDRAFT_486957 [Sistotremastrum niveocremeum HHB9708]|uniref:Uncharacterized protein n=1 Tax=Sistotremastrum niveocremeum HHB9708 TaxID=1314777 RepID=A0A164T2F7_9AGAM|nr:hypothetical protein SISNIDRAFT_486957 [Sistotremastrum niveocremeum HHB9708]